MNDSAHNAGATRPIFIDNRDGNTLARAITTHLAALRRDGRTPDEQIQGMLALDIVLPPEVPGRGAAYRVVREVVERIAEAYARNVNAKNAMQTTHNSGSPPWVAERLPTLQAYLADHPFLKNADYRELFDLERDAALRELRRLVQEGYLRAEGERRGARYLVGPGLGEPRA